VKSARVFENLPFEGYTFDWSKNALTDINGFYRKKRVAHSVRDFRIALSETNGSLLGTGEDAMVVRDGNR
jgi:hypothetical protein